MYSFGATRQRPLNLSANAEKALDWDDLDCVRLDSDPVEVPSKYTWCNWYMMDMLPPEGGTAINIYSILSSLTGNSMLEDSVNRTLDTLMSHTRVGINDHTLWGGDGLQYHHWGDLWGNLKPIDPPFLKKCPGKKSSPYLKFYDTKLLHKFSNKLDIFRILVKVKIFFKNE